MVRLLRVSHHGSRILFAEFQSHNGAIAAGSLILTNLHFTTFQSHNGEIAA